MRPIFNASWRARALAGDPAAVRLLADVNLVPLYRYCLYRVGRNRHLCEEVVQETLVRALYKLDQYDPERAKGTIFPWLVGLARNEIQRVLHQRSQTVPLTAEWDTTEANVLGRGGSAEGEPFSDDMLQREETRELVNATMAQLPRHYREVLEAKYVHGRSVRELAFQGQTSEKAVESLLTRARQAFRGAYEVLSRRHEHGSAGSRHDEYSTRPQ
ncbi:MAG: RNA polymerase sigma factor [Gemmataceae bacterium]